MLVEIFLGSLYWRSAVFEQRFAQFWDSTVSHINDKSYLNHIQDVLK